MRMYKQTEFAKKTGRSVGTVAMWVRTGNLPPGFTVWRDANGKPWIIKENLDNEQPTVLVEQPLE